MEKVEVYEAAKEEVESCSNQTKVSTPKKRKSKATEDTVEKTKKPRSAYLLYYFDVHQIMQQEVPNLPQSEINKRISESWKRLSVAEKAYYLEKAKSEKEGIDTSSLSPTKDLPGFRKILPRASYVFLSKGCHSNHQIGDSHSEVTMDSPGEEGCASVSLTQETQLTQLGLAGEVELSELPIEDDIIAEETTAVSCSTALQGTPASSSSSVTFQVPASTDIQVSTGLTAHRVTLKGNEMRASGGGYSWTTLQQIQGESSHVVAILPPQSMAEPKASVSAVGPVMMVSVGAKVEQSSRPPYKMSVKTYTRRGRGRCLNPGCSFVYVTRHKPPTCPECGSRLGGKWIPAVKQAKGAASKRSPQKAKTKSNECCQPTQLPAQDRNADANQTNIGGRKKEGQVQSSRKQHLAPAGQPPEGSSTKPMEETKQLKDSPKGSTVQGQDGSIATLQNRPVRPILPAYSSTGHALFQIITVPPDKGKYNTVNNKSSTAPRDSLSGLKPSTLKQLGQTVPATTAKQDSPVPADGSQTVSSLTDGRMNILSVMPFKKHTVSSLDLGLSTARGRGRCKNPSCDYVYKNRHKPALCPKCGCELTQKNTKGIKSGTLLDPYQALSPAQKDIQRQNTVQLLRRSLQVPECEAELQETLNVIQELNSLQIILVQPGQEEHEGSVGTETLVETGWPQFYESAATQCGLCNYPLFKGGQSTVAGQEDCWLLTETLMQTAFLQLKVCLNVQCLALHSFIDLHPGLFNIGNKLLVSIDLFLKIRSNIKLGQDPSQAARTILDHVPSHPVHALSPEELSQIVELLLCGYWAFESLTVRDYNDMICGICGVAPKVEIAQRHKNNVLELRNVEFTWPEYSVSDEVHVDDFWLTMESEAIEQAAFPSDIPITRVDASIVAPFIPPLMRSPTVINTEKDKTPLSHTQQPSGNPSVLVRLIHDGQLRLDKIEDQSEDELKTILTGCGATVTPGSTKDELLASLLSLYMLVHRGPSTAPQPPPHLTAGKLSKVCPHKVVCGSKYLVRGETARDHVDLLLSSRYWPPVYVSDCAHQVALCTDMQYPELAAQMWGRNQGCFCDPFEKPEYVSCAELQEQHGADLSLVAENQQLHPITKSSSCWLVHPPKSEQPTDTPVSEHHSMSICRDLEPYVSIVAELEKERKEEEEEGAEENAKDSPSNARWQPVVFSNTAYYYLYNRLVDYLTSRDIVNQQINQVVKACQPGEVVIRDTLYRLGVAQINNTDKDEEEECESKEQTQEGGAETYEVVLFE